MRNQALLLAALAAVVIGCGGGHHTNNPGTTTSTTGTNPGTSTGTTGTANGFTVAIPGATYGRVEIEYLTGQGRAQGDTYLEVTRQRIQNADAVDVYDNSAEGLAPRELDLAGFQTISTGIDIPISTSTNSQAISQFVFEPTAVKTEDASGNINAVADSDKDNVTNGIPVAGNVVVDASGNNPITLTTSQSLPANIESRIRAFPGRTSVVQVRVSSASFHALSGYFTTDINTGAPTNAQAYVFDLGQFTVLNDSTTGADPTGQGLLSSRLSDFIRFDLTHLSNPSVERPNVRTSYDATLGTTPAGYLYFSGDNIALSTVAAGGAFTELEPTTSITTDSNGNATETQDVVIGKWQPASTTASGASFTGNFVGTYSLTDAQPIDLNGTPARLVSLYGPFHDYTEYLTGGSTFEIIMFPNSGEEYDANRPGDIVGIVRNSSNQITSMYYGGMDLTAGGTSTKAGTFYLLPIRFLGLPATADTTGAELTGTVGSYVNASGAAVTTTNVAAIRKLKFSNLKLSTGSLPTGVAASGTVTVLRV